MAHHHFRMLARRPVSLPADVLALDGTWREEASITDLGLGGAGLMLRRVLSVGTQLRVFLVAPSLWDPLEIEGVVRWAGRPDRQQTNRLGVQFNPTSGQQVRALIDLIASTAYE